ncbi:MAG: energy transducer TonB [Prevotella sp.]|nr:energy transducer TonB [Prevotella sp.]
MKDFMYEPDTDIPIPTTEPYLIQSGVRFVYQKREVTAPEAGYVQEDIPFSEIQQYLTDEVKDVLKGSDSAKTKEIPVRTPNSGNAGNSVKSNHVLEPAKVYDVVDEMPQFPGGSQSMLEYLSKNIKYPVVAEENGVQGRVIVTFVVERDGSITNEKIVKSVDPSLSKEAIRVVKSMPHWIPGRQKGSAVRVKYTVPVTFKLDGSNKEVQNSSVQSRQQYTAWFVFGTKNELMRQNILMNDGTFSKTRLMDSSRDYFTKIDTRIDKEIKLYSKKANVLTSHPSSAYTLRPDENMRYVLRITDPQLFWSTSDYLVIIVE